MNDEEETVALHLHWHVVQPDARIALRFADEELVQVGLQLARAIDQHHATFREVAHQADHIAALGAVVAIKADGQPGQRTVDHFGSGSSLVTAGLRRAAARKEMQLLGAQQCAERHDEHDEGRFDRTGHDCQALKRATTVLQPVTAWPMATSTLALSGRKRSTREPNLMKPNSVPWCAGAPSRL